MPVQTHFQRLQKGSWDDAQFANGAEAMSAVLELVRRHQARALAAPTIRIGLSLGYTIQITNSNLKLHSIPALRVPKRLPFRVCCLGSPACQPEHRCRLIKVSSQPAW